MPGAWRREQEEERRRIKHLGGAFGREFNKTQGAESSREQNLHGQGVSAKSFFGLLFNETQSAKAAEVPYYSSSVFVCSITTSATKQTAHGLR